MLFETRARGARSFFGPQRRTSRLSFDVIFSAALTARRAATAKVGAQVNEEEENEENDAECNEED